MSIVRGSLDGGDDDSDSSQSSSAPESDDEIELEINDDAVAELLSSKKPAFIVPTTVTNSTISTSEKQKQENKKNNQKNEIIVDDTFGISYQRKANVRASTSDLAEQTPWTREYDRLNHEGFDLSYNGVDNVASTKNSTENKKEEGDDFDYDLTVPDLMPRSVTKLTGNAESSKAAQKAKEKLDDEQRMIVESMKAELAKSLEHENKESDGGGGGGDSDGSGGAIEKSNTVNSTNNNNETYYVKHERNKAARELFNKYDNTTKFDGMTSNENQKKENRVVVDPPPNIRLSIVAGQSVGLTSLAEGVEEEEEEEEEEVEEEEVKVKIGTAMTNAQETTVVENDESESEGEEVVEKVEVQATEANSEDDEIRRLDMEFDRVSASVDGSSGGRSKGLKSDEINIITYQKALRRLEDDIVDQGGIDAVLANDGNIGGNKMGGCGCFGGGKLILVDDRKFFFGLAKLKFQPTNKSHGHMLHTIFHSLEGDNVPLGSHRWMDIGFQGCDPATDIRGTGMLGVLQLLFFCERYSKLACQIHQLSNKESNKFPLAVAGFNFTLECMRGLRSGIFEKLIRKQQSVAGAMDLVYVSLMFHFHRGWKVRKYANHIEAIQHFSTFKDEVVENMKKNPIKFVETMRKNAS